MVWWCRAWLIQGFCARLRCDAVACEQPFEQLKKFDNVITNDLQKPDLHKRRLTTSPHESMVSLTSSESTSWAPVVGRKCKRGEATARAATQDNIDLFHGVARLARRVSTSEEIQTVTKRWRDY